MLHGVVKERIANEIQPKSAQRYLHRVIQCLNREDEEEEGHKQKMGTIMINILGLRHKREIQSYPRIAWFLLNKIYHMYSDIKKK